MRLLPREEKFYQLFIRQTEITADAARLLVEGVSKGNSRLAVAATEINVLEHQGDEVIHETIKRLNQTFITPLDPEDIHAISSALDDVLDGIEETAHRLVAYQIDPLTDTMLTLAQVVESCAKAIQKAVLSLEKHGAMLEHCIEVNRLENEADRIGRSAVSDLFRHEKDPIRLIKVKEVYEFLESTIDKCEDVADLLQNVAVKHS